MQTSERADAIVAYWLGNSNLGPAEFDQQSRRWYYASPETDQAIRDQFSSDLSEAELGELDDWVQSKQGMLALVILLDQFSRNLYRGTADAFRNDTRAQQLLTAFIATGQDQTMTVPERLLVYHPYLHAEDAELQQQIVGFYDAMLPSVEARWRPVVERSARYSREHADVISRFGRFPHRNEILGRPSTTEELAFLAADPRDYGQGNSQGAN